MTDSHPSVSNDREVLALVHEGWDHLKLQRPLAAWASWQRALRRSPGDSAAREALDMLATTGELPLAARAVYRFVTPADTGRRERWDECFRGRDLQDLAAAGQAFRALTEADPADAPAWYNAAFCSAWLGSNIDALAALERFVSLRAETEPETASEAWALGEVLRQGAGAERLADDLSYSLSLGWGPGDPEPSSVGALLPVATPPDTDPAGGSLADVEVFEWLDRPPPDPSEIRDSAGLPHILARAILTAGTLRLSSPDPRGLAEAEARLAEAIRDPDRPTSRQAKPLPLSLLDAAVWSFRMPAGLDEEARARLSREAVEHYYEDVWIHAPRHGLDDRSPLAAAAGDAVARAKLEGVIRLREQLAARPRTAPMYAGYPFDRLRQRLGLEARDPGTVDPGDFACMSGPQLDKLVPGTLDDIALAEAYQSAAGLADEPRTARFAEALASRPPEARIWSRIDAIAPFATLVRHALAQRDPARALAWLDRASQSVEDAATQRTFATWRAEIHARTGAPEEAERLYRSILEEGPADPRLALEAASTMLDNGHPRQARSLLHLARELARLADDPIRAAQAEALLASTS